ncbi:MAG TPA: hypothetical protein VN944_09315 [Nitrospiria bacterium]|nr:hypothetical protein [Nitrospiria bacterium]
MSVRSDLNHVAIFQAFIRKTEANLFTEYIERSKEETPATDDLIPKTLEEIRLEKVILGRIKGLKVFLHLHLGVEKILREKLSNEVFDHAIANCNKTVTYIEYVLADDAFLKNRAKEKAREDLPEDVLKRTIFDVMNGGKECILIPVDAFVSIPSRDDNPISMAISLFGTPMEVYLRRRGLLKGKMTVSEYRYEMTQSLFFRISPAMDKALANKKLNESDFNFIKKFIFKIRHLMTLYQGIKKGELHLEDDKPLIPSITYINSNKIIENTMKNLKKGGVDERRAGEIKTFAFNNQKKIKCIVSGCNNTFVPINKNHLRCDSHSEPKVFLKEWRDFKNHDQNGFSIRNNQPSEKIIYQPFINPNDYLS